MNTQERAARLGISVRVILNEDAPAMQTLAAENMDNWMSADGSMIELDWSQAFPYWLGAEQENAIVAAIQVLPARPIGRAECLMVRSGVRKRVRAVAVKLLLDTTLVVMARHGVQLVSGLCPEWMPEYKRVLEHMGSVDFCQGSIMMTEVSP